MEQTPPGFPVDLSDLDEQELQQTLTDGADSAGSYTKDRADRFYDRVRGRIQSYLDQKGAVAGKSAEYLLLVPDIFMLLWRLLNDARVGGKNKVLLGSAVAYYVFPFDLVPEAFLGPIGYLDDLVFGVIVLNKMISEVEPEVLREHWSGKEDLLESIRKVMGAADDLVSKDVIDKVKKMAK
jgi:uncharacterized membrane protein YkvA (DUF1232 family)